MNKEDNFDWLVREIDECLIFMLKSGKEMLGSYYAESIRINGIDLVSVKFANINDLTNFVNYSLIRFVNSLDKTNIIDIPIKKIYTLVSTAKRDGSGMVELDELNSFAVLNDKVVSRGYAVVPYLVKELDQEVLSVIKKISTFDSLSMNDKIDALEDINLVSYHKIKEKEGLKK